MSPTMNLTERLLHALRARGATEVFGIPGDFALPLFGEIERSGVLPLYTLSHEPAVGFAADAAARLTGLPGVALVRSAHTRWSSAVRPTIGAGSDPNRGNA